MRKGNYAYKMIYYKGEKWWLAYDVRRKKRNNHTHIPYNNENAARMVVVRADRGKIPEGRYPDWMIESINRLWYGKNFRSRTDLNNDNLLVRDPKVRIKRRKKPRGCKNYYNTPKHFRA